MPIYDTNDSFNFDNLVLTKPASMAGGNYFIRCLVNSDPLYIQPPKCKTKQGIIKTGKRYYSDLMFTNENDNFIRWMENLENHCQEYIFKNREKWFDGDMEMHDIENYFTSPLKIYKSGNYYLCRINVTNNLLGKITLKIYDENENEVDIEKIDDKITAITILEIQGIKCSAKSFQIEIELKQMMVLSDKNDLFEKCVIKPSISGLPKSVVDGVVTDSTVENKLVLDTENPITAEKDNSFNIIVNTSTEEGEVTSFNQNGDLTLSNITVSLSDSQEVDDVSLAITTENNVASEIVSEIPIDTNGIEEIELHLEELDTEETVQLKKRNDVFYEMYREARKKAKIARDLALSSYLEAKRIKNTYLLDDLKDSDDDSDLEMDEEDSSEDEEEISESK